MIKINIKNISNNEIKNELKSLKNSHNKANYFWDTQSEKIISEFINKDPKQFLNFKSIGETMFVGRRAKYIYYEYYQLLKNKKIFSDLNKTLNCNNFGNPKSFPINLINRNTNSNMIHQSYHLMRLLKESNIDLKKIDNIFEFGGGYGALCKVIFNSGFKGNYYIYDLPIMSSLQKFWISNSDFDNTNNIFLTNNTSELDKIAKEIIKGCNLFISNWALSESPMELRNEFENFFNNFNFLSLAIQKKFQNVDNIQYIKSLKKTLLKSNDLLLFDKNIKHIKNSSYIFGVKI